MGVVKQNKKKAKKDDLKKLANGKSTDENKKVKKKKLVSCLQCIKPGKDEGGLEGKYRVAAPELMQDTFMSDSEDEGGEVECPIQQQQQYRYMNSEAGTLHRAKPLEDTVTDGHLWPSNNDKRVATIDRQPLDIGFLVSFVVDARGGAMKAKRRGGVRVIVPPAACTAPTRVTCRAATRRAPVAAPPPLMEGEALASRLLELQPQGAKFLAPVVIEVPIYTTSCREREIVILRSDTGETWQDHYQHNNDNPLIQEALQRERQEYGSGLETMSESGERVTRIITCDFPHYLACVSRVRQEVHVIGPEGGTVSSAHIPQVQALFPPQALTKRIRVGLQAHGASAELCRRRLPRHACVSPVVTVEPRRRKFHRTITLTAPLPVPHDGTKGKPSTTNLRLLCSIMGGQARAVWEDVTGSTPLTVTDDCASFTTTVSARFWMMNCQNVSDATKLATELYREMLLVPFEVRIVVLGKRLDALEGRLLVMYITDRYAYDTLLQQEHYTEVAHSTSVQFLDGKDVYLEFSGNLVPVTKSGSQPMFHFEAFKDNRVEFPVRVKHNEESPSGRIYFMNEPKVAKGEASATPACVLDVLLPDTIAPRAAKSQLDYLNLDQSGFDALKDELSFHWGEHNNSLGPGSLPYQHDGQLNGHDKIITNGNVKYPNKDNADTGPQVNGDSLHVDSNKTKATFDSDEDKTPMNTLEKGKKKSEGGFLGGLADRVKNVFGHSEDKEDDKEPSPIPQPKPRESKEKSPPKPAPRLINEDLLGKVEDMFKDLHSKPPQKDEEDPTSQVYATKLVVDEEDKPVTEDIYEQYDHMQPVETPLRISKTDPFQFYVGCCEGKYKKGQKHRHDETSNVVDRIEQVNFTAREKLQDISEKVHGDVTEELEKAEKEKDNIKQKANEAIYEIVEDYHKVKNDVKDKEDKLKSDSKSKIEQFENVSANAISLSDNIQSEIDDGKLTAKGDSVVQKIGLVKDDLTNKALLLDFAAMERSEEMKLRGNEKLDKIGSSIENDANDLNNRAQVVGADLKCKVRDSTNTMSDTIRDMKGDLSQKAQDIKFSADETADNVKGVADEKLQSLEESVDVVKEKTKKTKEELKKEAKKKSKEGKNFFTGLVHNIFGEKEKVEDEVTRNITEGKESAGKILDKASAKSDKIKDSVAKKQDGFAEGIDQLSQNVQDKNNKTEQAIQDMKDEIENSFEDNAIKAKLALQNQTGEITDIVNEKSVEIKGAAQRELDAAKQTIDDTSSVILEKKIKVEDAITNKASEIGDAVHDETSEAVQGIHDKANKLGDAIQHKSKQVKDSFYDTSSEVKDALHDKIEGAKDNINAFGHSIQDEANKVKHNINHKTNEAKGKASEAGHAINDEVSKFGGAIQDKTSEAKDKANEVAHIIKDKASKVGHAIQDKATEAEEKSSDVGHVIHDETSKVGDLIHDKASKTKDKIGGFGHAIKEKFSGFGHFVHDNVSDADESINESARNLGTAVYDKKSELGETIHDKASEFKHAINDKAHEANEKACEVRCAVNNEANNISHDIAEKATETKDAVYKISDEVQQEVHEKSSGFGHALKDTFSGLGHAISDTFSGIGHALHDKTSEVHDTANETKDVVHKKVSEIKDSVEDKAVEFKDTIHENTSQSVKSLQDKTNEIENSIQGKKEELGHAISNKKVVAQTELDRIRQKAEQTTDEIKKSAEDAINATASKRNELQNNIVNTFDEFQQFGKDESEHLQKSATDKVNDLQRSSKHAFDHVQDSTLSTFDRVESSAKDKVNDAKDKWEDIQSSTRDTFADMRDDVHSLGSSTQDTLHSFQSSAGNTFDSLDDSAKEFFGSVQTSAQNIEDGSRQLFGEAKESFEGFQVSADNKLEDLKGATKEKVDEVGARLGEAAEDVKEGVRGTEQAMADTIGNEADRFTSSLNNLGSSVFGSSGKGFMKDSSTKLLESEKAQSSPHKKSSGIPKLKKKNRK